MSEPYYSSDRVQLYLGDCREIVPTLPKRCADLLIADPPYGVKWQSSWRKEAFGPMEGDAGDLDWPHILGNIVTHALRSHRHSYVFGYRPESLAAPMRLGRPVELIWDKGIAGMGDLTSPYGPAHEVITFGCHIASDAERGAGRGSLSARLRQGSVLRYPNARSIRVRHPTEKPVALLRQLIESSSVHGETVLDPTAGIGSTGVAAILEGRKAILIETELRWAQVAVERIKAAEHVMDQVEAL